MFLYVMIRVVFWTLLIRPVRADFGDLFSVKHEPGANHHIKEHAKEHIKDEIEFHKLQHDVLPKDAECKGDDCPCKKCCVGGVVWLVKEIVEKSDAACGKLELPSPITTEDEIAFHLDEPSENSKKEMWCKFWKSSREVALGFIVEMVRPWSLAHAWCLGHGECKMQPPTTALEDLKFDGDLNVPMDAEIIPDGDKILAYGSEEPGDGVAYSSEPEKPVSDPDIPKKPQVAPELVVERRLSLERRLHTDDHRAHGHVCPRCYKKVTGIVMRRAIGGAKKMCEVTKCPFLKKWCVWAGKHAKMAYGMLLAKVEPWKYAIGRCWHGHGHHGHHPDHPDHDHPDQDDHGSFWHRLWHREDEGHGETHEQREHHLGHHDDDEPPHGSFWYRFWHRRPEDEVHDPEEVFRERHPPLPDEHGIPFTRTESRALPAPSPDKEIRVEPPAEPVPSPWMIIHRIKHAFGFGPGQNIGNPSERTVDLVGDGPKKADEVFV